MLPATNPATKPHSFNDSTSRKRSKRKSTSGVDETPPQCHIKKLPLELLTEILQLTESPKDVLSVARACKYFCDLLVNPAQSFVWKSVRQVYPVPPPDPMSIFSEVGYASFLFDGGRCTVCNESTDMPLFEFALQLRLCRHEGECRRALDLATSWRHPSASIEGPLALKYSNIRCLDPLASRLRKVLPYRAGGPSVDSLWFTFRRCPEIGTSEGLSAFIESKADRIERVAAYMTLCEFVRTWKIQVDEKYLSIKGKNSTFMHQTSTKLGWDQSDLKNFTQFGALCRTKIKRLELITDADLDRMKAQTDEELVRLADKRLNRQAENLYRDNRREVSRHFNRLRSRLPHPVLPPLYTFRQLPIVSILQGSPAPSESSKPIGNSFQNTDWVSSQLQSNLDAWREKAKSQLAGILGYLNWKTASKTVVHPVDRVTARFRCKNCSKMRSNYQNNECFDFAGACAHTCPFPKKDRRSKEPWKAQNFIKDEKAVNIIETLVQMSCMDVSRAEDNLLVTVRNVVCKSCNPPLPMDWKCLIGHCHRHENMQIQLASVIEDMWLIAHPLKHGVVMEHIRPGHRALAARQKSLFGCRHCTLRAYGGTATEIFSASRLKPPALYSFDGLRSHLKAKHHVEKIRDEDVVVK